MVQITAWPAFSRREIDTLSESGFPLWSALREDRNDLRGSFKWKERRKHHRIERPVNLIRASRARSFTSRMERAGVAVRPRFKLVIPRKSH